MVHVVVAHKTIWYRHKMRIVIMVTKSQVLLCYACYFVVCNCKQIITPQVATWPTTRLTLVLTVEQQEQSLTWQKLHLHQQLNKPRP